MKIRDFVPSKFSESNELEWISSGPSAFWIDQKIFCRWWPLDGPFSFVLFEFFEIFEDFDILETLFSAWVFIKKINEPLEAAQTLDTTHP